MSWIEELEARHLAELDARVAERSLKRRHRSERWQAIVEQRAIDAARRALEREARDRPCGAKTRAGHPCKRRGIGKGGRCANHGGLSTGPKTEEGRQRIREAQKRRWSAWRNHNHL